jgi:hypothetical protein
MTKVTTITERPSWNPFSDDMVVQKEVADESGSTVYEGRGPTLEEARANADNAIRSR